MKRKRRDAIQSEYVAVLRVKPTEVIAQLPDRQTTINNGDVLQIKLNLDGLASVIWNVSFKSTSSTDAGSQSSGAALKGDGKQACWCYPGVCDLLRGATLGVFHYCRNGIKDDSPSVASPETATPPVVAANPYKSKALHVVWQAGYDARAAE